MLKNIIAYRIGAGWSAPPVDKIDEELQRLAFVPCGPTQTQSAGWLPPRGEEHGAMVEAIGGHLILKLAVERRSVPAAAVRAELEARCKKIEAESGRKPGRKEKAEIKDDVLFTLLPRAFGKRTAHTVWINPEARLLVVEAGSVRAAEPAVKLLVDVLSHLEQFPTLSPIVTAQTAASAMAGWLVNRQAPAGFTIDRNLELKKFGEERSVVRYARHTLELDEIGQHIQEGKLPTQLALTWNDKVSFVLTEDLAIRGVDIRNVEEAPKGEDGFDADVAIATGELSAMLPDLLEALGGELAPEPDLFAAAQPAAPAATDANTDALYNEALQVVRANRRASISLVQRHLKLGYNRAAALLEEMEKRGAVSPMGRDGARKILAEAAA